MSNRVKTRYEISHESPFMPNLADGVHEHTMSDGTVVKAHVEDGQIAGYTAHDSSGAKISVRRLKLTNTTGTNPPSECMYCVCKGDTCKCYVEPCPK